MNDTISTKQKIVYNALSLIREKGFDCVTIKDICEVSNISKHTFYYYFTSKESLLHAFFKISREIKSENLSHILDAENNFEMYWRLIEPTIDFFVDSGIQITKQLFICNMSKEIGTFSKEDNEKNAHFDKMELSVIEKSQLSGEINNMSSPKDLAKSNFTSNMGICQGWCMHNGNFDLKNACRKSTEVIFDLRKDLRKSL